MNKIKLAIIIIIFMLASAAQGAVYYVNGVSGNDSDLGTISLPWKTINKANQTLVAGDTVYIRGGVADYQVYAVPGENDGIKPSNSGTLGNPITYSVYPGEKVHFVGQADDGVSHSRGIYLQNRSYIKVTGVSGYNLKFSKMWKHLYITGDEQVSYKDYDFDTKVGGSNYNEIAYCEFTNSGQTGWYYTYYASVVRRNSSYNHIHDCKFSRHGGWLYSGGTYYDQGVLLAVGYESATYGSGYPEDKSHFNVVENCEFFHVGHNTISMDSKYSVFRNNYTHNESWWYDSTNYYASVYGGPLPYTGYWGYRNTESYGYYGSHGRMLVEGNRFGYGEENPNPGNWGGSGMSFSSSHNILRYNSIFNNWIWGVYLKSYTDRPPKYNTFYNNTFYYNGHHPWSTASMRQTIECSTNCSYGLIIGNIFKNNLFYKNYARDSSYAQIDCDLGCNTVDHNWDDKLESYKADVLFVSEDTSDKTSWTLPNFNLQSGSPAIDGGTYLTQANGAGVASTTLVVNDASYFQDGNFGLGALTWPSNISVQADWIGIGTVSNIAQISSINYSTNTITLKSPMTWSDRANIWLYKKSDGKQVLYGSAPDYGAYEFNSVDGKTHQTLPPPGGFLVR